MEENFTAKWNRVLIFGVLFLAMVILALGDGYKGVLMPIIKDDLSASFEQIGFLNSAVSFGNVLASLLAAFLLNHFGIKKTLITGYLIVFGVMISFLFIPSFGVAAAAFSLLRFGFVIYLMGINGLAATSTSSPGKMLTLTHFFYGFGAIFGPALAGYFLNNNIFTWKTIFPATSVLIILVLLITLPTKMPQIKSSSDVEGQKPEQVKVSIKSILRMPEVWLFAVTASFLGQLEVSTSLWGTLYLKDVLNVDPKTLGATFLSVFFLFFAVARLLSGFFIEKVGYVRTEKIAVASSILIMLTGFLLGEHGIWVLAASGFPIAIMWPTLLSIISRAFHQNAPVFMSMILSMCGVISIFMQFFTGWINQNIGPQWGYRYLLIPGTIGLILFTFLIRHLKKKNYPIA